MNTLLFADEAAEIGQNNKYLLELVYEFKSMYEGTAAGRECKQK